MEELKLTSPDFTENDWMPEALSARGENRSPLMHLTGLNERAAFLAITMEDESHPIIPYFCHWLLWNLPAAADIPAIPCGAELPALGGARQGIAYGRHMYKGPKPPLRAVHRYIFTVYVLDAPLDLPADSRKEDLLAAMGGHVLQRAQLVGKYQSHRG